MEVKFVSTTSKIQNAKAVVEVKFVSTTGKDQVSKTVEEVKFEHNKIKSRCKRCGGS